MPFNRETAVERAKQDLAHRLGVTNTEIVVDCVEEKEFSDMSLGASAGDEISAQMISNGWLIILKANGLGYEYRADKYQIRLCDFKGENFLIEG